MAKIYSNNLVNMVQMLVGTSPCYRGCLWFRTKISMNRSHGGGRLEHYTNFATRRNIWFCSRRDGGAGDASRSIFRASPGTENWWDTEGEYSVIEWTRDPTADNDGGDGPGARRRADRTWLIPSMRTRLCLSAGVGYRS